MKWSTRILFLLWALLFAEDLSRVMAGGPGPCLIGPEPSQQVGAGDQHQDCPTFFAGMLTVIKRGDEWIKQDDNDKAVVAAFTVVLAISTIGLWLATNKLWAAGEKQSRDMQRSIAAFEAMSREARKANEISEKSVLFANRAWVGIERVGHEALEIGKPITVLIAIRNSGHSLALHTRGGFNAALLKKGQEPDNPLTTQIDSAATVIIPNGAYHYYPFSGYAPLTKPELDSILAGDTVIWIVGRVEYQDVSGQSHYTTYKLQYDLKEKAFSTAIDGTDAT